MEMQKSSKVVYIPYLLVDKIEDKESKITTKHLFAYSLLYKKLDWDVTPVQVNNITPEVLAEDLSVTTRQVYRILEDLSDEGFVKRIYDEGRKRDRYITLQLLSGMETENEI